jgi:hypothetical protein
MDNIFHPESLMMSHGFHAADHQGAIKSRFFRTLPLHSGLRRLESRFSNWPTDCAKS